jgi:hypothetical protein
MENCPTIVITAGAQGAIHQATKTQLKQSFLKINIPKEQ